MGTKSGSESVAGDTRQRQDDGDASASRLVSVRPRDSRGTGAAAGAGRVATRRLLRSVALGTLALGLAVVYFADMFGVDRQELIGYLGISALLLVGLVAAAALAAMLLRLIRRRR